MAELLWHTFDRDRAELDRQYEAPAYREASGLVYDDLEKGALALAEDLGLPFIQEVAASSMAIRKVIPDADVVIELGGEDAKLTYLTGGLFDQVKVFRATANSQGFEVSSLYDPDMISQNDPYDVFLGGACSVVILENPSYAADTKTLYLFSDSFGRSIAPQLLEGYSRVVLIDIRYIRASRLPELVDYQSGNDVLFLYSIETLDTASSLNTD